MRKRWEGRRRWEGQRLRGRGREGSLRRAACPPSEVTVGILSEGDLGRSADWAGLLEGPRVGMLGWKTLEWVCLQGGS